MNSFAANTVRDTANALHNATDSAFETANNAVAATRDHANEALDKAEQNVRTMRGRVDPMVEMLAEKAQNLARQSLDLASEAKDRAQQSLTRAAGVTTRYVSEQPVRSILIAAAVGAAVALAVSASRNRNHNRY